MSTGKKLGLAFLASAVMAVPTSASAQQQQVLCARDINSGTVVCPEQHQRAYTPTGPAQQQYQPPVVVEQPNPVATFFTGLALGVVGAVVVNHGRHHGGHGYVGGPRYVAPADRFYYDNRPVTVDPHGYVYRNPSNGCYRTERGSVHCP